MGWFPHSLYRENEDNELLIFVRDRISLFNRGDLVEVGIKRERNAHLIAHLRFVRLHIRQGMLNPQTAPKSPFIQGMSSPA